MSPAPVVRTVPVLAVLVCHDGAEWLRLALSALRHSVPRPRHVVAVDTGSGDDTARLLAAAATGADKLIDGVITLPRDTGYTTAVHTAVDHAVDRWGDPGGWIWLLHDDSAPDPDCLATLLTAADMSPAVGVLGPLAVDWHDPRLVVEAGLSTDASGHRQTGIGPSELDWGRLGRGSRNGFEQSTEVLAVSSAGMLVRRELWQRLGGFDQAMPMLREDIDFGWRANRAGAIVLCVPSARLRHARAVARELRGVDAHPAALGSSPRAVDRAHGLRTFLVNCSLFSYLIGLPRLGFLCLVRALGFAMQRRLTESRAELRALAYLFGGSAGLSAARASRRATATTGSVRGLFTSRLTRLRNAARGALSTMVRRRVEADAALGRLPSDYDSAAVWLAPDAEPAAPRRPTGLDSLPAGATKRPARSAGLRRPTSAIAVPLVVPDDAKPIGLRPSPRPRPSPGKPGAPAEPSRDLMLVQVDRGRVLRQILLSPPLVLLLALTALAIAVNWDRFGLDLAGGRLLPVGDLVATWSDYLANWHPVEGGTTAPAPAALAVIGGLGTVLAPIGGPAAAVALLLLADLPLAGLSAYLATRRAPVRRWVRALVAAGYALLPPAAAAVAQGRLDVVVVHVLLPLVTAGIGTLLVRRGGGGPNTWLSVAACTAFGLAVIGAFSPLTHLLLVAAALAGFVLVPGHRGDGRRRGAALFVLVLMPLALLLPWPAVVIQHPGVVLHGLGGRVADQAVSALELISLHPGGPGAWSLVGLTVVGAVLVGLLVRPNRAVLPGLAFALLGVLAVALLRLVPMTPLDGGAAEHGWSGAALLIVGWGLLLALLALCRLDPGAPARPGLPVRVWALLGVIGLGVLIVGTLIPGRDGPLRQQSPGLAATLRSELAVTGRSVLYVGDQTRLIAGREARFADDDLAPVPGATTRLAGLAERLRSADAATVRGAVADATSAGVIFVVLPDPAAGRRFTAAAGDLAADVPPTEDGRPVFRLQLAAGRVTLLSPDLARQALTNGPPPTELGAGGIVPVEAAPPNVAVRVSDGPQGRLLVVAAEDEPGWRATVDGKSAPIQRAWGHLVAVAVPTRAAEVRIEQPTALRSVLLLTQAAVVLFTFLTAIPGRRKPEPD